MRLNLDPPGARRVPSGGERRMTFSWTAGVEGQRCLTTRRLFLERRAGRSGPGGAFAGAEDDERLGVDDLGAAAAAAADLVDDAFEVVDVGHAQAHKCVGVAGEGEGFDELGEVADGCVDVCDLGAGSEPEFCERFQMAVEPCAIEHGGVAADVAAVLQAVDAALGGGGREPDDAPDLAGGAAGVLDEEVQDSLIDGVQIVSCHAQIVRCPSLQTQRFVVSRAKRQRSRGP
jgi:hypothetical protein